jgi:glycosyltransferase involved in cell wall biosynthesis/GT2 family glycosyltransferase
LPPPRPIVLLVSDEYPPYTAWGGNAYNFAHMARRLSEAGFEVEIIAESTTDEEFTHLDPHGNLVHRVSGARSYTMKALKAVAGSAAQKLAFRDVSFAARVAERALEITELWNRRILWVETSNWRVETLFLHLLPKLNERIAVHIITPMAEVVKQNNVDRANLETRVALFLEVAQQFLLKHRVYSNEEYREYFEERVRTDFKPLRQPNERVFPLPFDFARVPRRTKPLRAVKGRPLRILMVGRIEPRKGFETICAALSHLPPEQRSRVQIYAVGRDTDLGPFGSYKALLQEKYPDIMESNFHLLGNLSEEALRAQFSQADVGMVASTSESFGYNLVELLAADLPVLTSRVGAVEELGRRGVRYLGVFDTIPELSQLFADLPRLHKEYLAAGVTNRDALEAMYEKVDREYLAYMTEQVAKLPAGVPYRARTEAERPVRSADIIVPSYNRLEELCLSLPSLVRGAEEACEAGIPCDVTIVYQNKGMPERVYVHHPQLEGHPRLRWVFSDRPSLTRARNLGVRSTRGDLVIFTDDDVVLEPGFVLNHVKVANAHPRAAGIAGGLTSRSEGRTRSSAKSVGYIRSSGFVDPYFNSTERSSRLVAMTPMGANMAYRRSVMNAILGEQWFDERFTGSAFREETTLGVEVYRRGHYYVFAPEASLYHFESVRGGCGNRARRTSKQQVWHYTLEYLYLNKLYEPSALLRAVAPLLLLRRDLGWSPTMAGKLKRAYEHLRGFAGARKLYRQGPGAPPPPPAETPTLQGLPAEPKSKVA